MEEFNCKIDGCDYTTNSTRGLFSHSSQLHGEEKTQNMREEICIEIIDDIMSNLASDEITRDEFHELSPVSMQFIKDTFGTYKNGIEEVGYQTCKVKTQELKDEIKRVSKQHYCGNPPLADEFNEKANHSKSTIANRFGSWNKALQECGFEPNEERNIGEEKLLNEICNLKDDLGYVPSQYDMKEKGKYSISVYQYNFGTWVNAVEEAGFEPVLEATGDRHAYYNAWEEEMPCSTWQSGEDHEMWLGGSESYYGPNWFSKRREALKRADYECEHPNCSKTVCDTGEGLHCHHIIPNKLTDSKTEHDLDNLLIVCREHHLGENGVEPIEKAKRPLD